MQKDKAPDTKGKALSVEDLNKEPLHTMFHLSTEGYYFEYRPDRNDSNIKRATLYKTTTNETVNDVRVSAGYGKQEKSHHDVINFFEAELTLAEWRKQNPIT